MTSFLNCPTWNVKQKKKDLRLGVPLNNPPGTLAQKLFRVNKKPLNPQTAK